MSRHFNHDAAGSPGRSTAAPTAQEPPYIDAPFRGPAPRRAVLRADPEEDTAYLLGAARTAGAMMAAAMTAANHTIRSMPATYQLCQEDVLTYSERARDARIRPPVVAVLPAQADRIFILVAPADTGLRTLQDVRRIYVRTGPEAALAQAVWALSAGALASQAPLIYVSPATTLQALTLAARDSVPSVAAIWACPTSPAIRALAAHRVRVIPYVEGQDVALRVLASPATTLTTVDVTRVFPLARVRTGRAAASAQGAPESGPPPPPRLLALWSAPAVLWLHGDGVNSDHDVSALANAAMLRDPVAPARAAHLDMLGLLRWHPVAAEGLRAWHARQAQVWLEPLDRGATESLRVGRPVHPILRDATVAEAFQSAPGPEDDAGRAPTLVPLDLQPPEHVNAAVTLAEGRRQRVLRLRDPQARLQGVRLAVGDRVTLRHQRRGADENGLYVVVRVDSTADVVMESPVALRPSRGRFQMAPPSTPYSSLPWTLEGVIDGDTARRVLVGLRPGDTVLWAPEGWPAPAAASVLAVDARAGRVRVRVQPGALVEALYRGARDAARYDGDKFHPLSACSSADPNAPAKEICERTRGAVWDRPCEHDADCPFFQANTARVNYRGGCVSGYCEMPAGVERVGWRHYDLDGRRPVCRCAADGVAVRTAPGCACSTGGGAGKDVVFPLDQFTALDRQ